MLSFWSCPPNTFPVSSDIPNLTTFDWETQPVAISEHVHTYVFSDALFSIWDPDNHILVPLHTNKYQFSDVTHVAFPSMNLVAVVDTIREKTRRLDGTNVVDSPVFPESL